MTMVLAGARLGTFTEVNISIAVLLVHCSCWQNSRNTFPKSLLARSHFRIPRKRLTTISLRFFQRKQSYQKNVITQKIKTFANCIDIHTAEVNPGFSVTYSSSHGLRISSCYLSPKTRNFGSVLSGIVCCECIAAERLEL